MMALTELSGTSSSCTLNLSPGQDQVHPQFFVVPQPFLYWTSVPQPCIPYHPHWGSVQSTALPEPLHPCIRVFNGVCNYRPSQSPHARQCCAYAFFPAKCCLKYLKNSCQSAEAGRPCMEYHPSLEECIEHFAKAGRIPGHGLKEPFLTVALALQRGAEDRGVATETCPPPPPPPPPPPCSSASPNKKGPTTNCPPSSPARPALEDPQPGETANKLYCRNVGCPSGPADVFQSNDGSLTYGKECGLRHCSKEQQDRELSLMARSGKPVQFCLRFLYGTGCRRRSCAFHHGSAEDAREMLRQLTALPHNGFKGKPSVPEELVCKEFLLDKPCAKLPCFKVHPSNFQHSSKSSKKECEVALPTNLASPPRPADPGDAPLCPSREKPQAEKREMNGGTERLPSKQSWLTAGAPQPGSVLATVRATIDRLCTGDSEGAAGVSGNDNSWLLVLQNHVGVEGVVLAKGGSTARVNFRLKDKGEAVRLLAALKLLPPSVATEAAKKSGPIANALRDIPLLKDLGLAQFLEAEIAKAVGVPVQVLLFEHRGKQKQARSNPKQDRASMN